MPRFPLNFDEDNLGNSRIIFTRMKEVDIGYRNRNSAASSGQLVDPGTGNPLYPDPNFETIELYVPQGLVFPDGSSYSNTDLGPVGNAMASAARGTALADASQILDNVLQDEAAALIVRGIATAAPAAIAGALTRRFGSFGGVAAAALGGAAVQQGINFGTGRIFNPNTKALFQGVNIRGFTFQFQMIPQSREEANEVATIVKYFRSGVYPESTRGITVRYPPKWLIEILPGPDYTEGRHMIKFKPAFLINASTSYNPGSQMYHSGGAPVETTITISFSEAETIDQQDIADGF